MESINESILNRYPNVITYKSTKEIVEQMEKCICKIKIGEMKGTGFFCKIPFPYNNKMLPVFITNNHVITKFEEEIKIYIEGEYKERKINFNNDRMIYTSNEEKYDITIIEVKEDDNIKNFLELDDIILDQILNDSKKNDAFLDKTAYIIQYPEGELSVSYGIILGNFEDKNYDFKHKCSTRRGSSGSPILNAINNRIIGIHKKGLPNYNIGTFLNEPIKEFIKKYSKNNEELLKEFNKKYNLNIENTKITKLEITYKKLGNEGLKDLCEIDFKLLKKLELISCGITDIKILEKAKFEKLEILDLSDERNYISDINVLEKVNFKELKKLCLNFQKISDIGVLEHVNFYNLEILDIGWNFKISDINVLEKVNFKKLKELNLMLNDISDINILQKVKFDKLEVLSLGKNKIKDINVLENVNFKELRELYFGNKNKNSYWSGEGNYIQDIKVLQKVKFDKLEILDLGNNQISNINVLAKVNFKKLKELFLDSNKISDINILEKADFKELKTLSFEGNQISDINVLKKVNFKKLKELFLDSNKISDINVLEKVDFKELMKLNLSYNKISDIKVLQKVKFDKLEILTLSCNKISDIKILEKVNFKELKILYLDNNQISNIKILQKVKFDKLEDLQLHDNKIDMKINDSIISKFKSKLKYFYI